MSPFQSLSTAPGFELKSVWLQSSHKQPPNCFVFWILTAGSKHIHDPKWGNIFPFKYNQTLMIILFLGCDYLSSCSFCSLWLKQMSQDFVMFSQFNIVVHNEILRILRISFHHKYKLHNCYVIRKRYHSNCIVSSFHMVLNWDWPILINSLKTLMSNEKISIYICGSIIL